MPEMKDTIEHFRIVPFKMLVKGTAIIMVAPTMLLIIFTIYDRLDTLDAIFGWLAIFLVSVIFVRPYIANLSALTQYVHRLIEDKKAEPPDLSFLNNVEELSSAVEQLQHSWEVRKQMLEGYLGESKILIDSLPDILIMLDRNLNVVQTNNTAQSAFRGKYFQETLESIINNSKIRETARQVLEEKKGRDVEFSLPPPIDREYIVRIERFPVHSHRGIAIFLVMHDITELKRTEQTFADFVANASHEIRTPLTSIVGFIETLQTSAKDDPIAQEKFLALMAEQAERMSRLVKDLLSLSKIEKNISTPPTSLVDIEKIITEVVQQTSWNAEQKNVTLEVNVPKLPEIIADYGELSQVLYNLITNAIKYGNDDSSVIIDAELVPNKMPDERIFRSEEQLMRIAVTDQGEGIAPEHLDRLTERFYRVDAARSRKLGGTGLGLAIVKHILDRHRGLLTIESELGKGSTFIAWLPATDV